MAERAVVDASVVVKWFLRDGSETDCDLADEVLAALLARDVELYAPEILVYEVCGVLTRACLTRLPGLSTSRITKNDAAQCVRDLISLPIQIMHLDADALVRALELAVDFSKTHWDMSYVGLANRLGCQWLTADEKFLAAIRAGFPAHLVVRLSDLRQT